MSIQGTAAKDDLILIAGRVALSRRWPNTSASTGSPESAPPTKALVGLVQRVSGVEASAWI